MSLKDILTSHRIGTESVSRGVQDVNLLTSKQITAFNAEFGLEVAEFEAAKAAKYAVHAVLNGADTSEKVANYVYMKVTRVKPKVVPAPAVVAVNFAASLGDSLTESEGVIAPMLVAEPVVQGPVRRGRVKVGPSKWDEAAKLMADNPTITTREGRIALLMENGTKESSAKVYAWRYDKEEQARSA